MAGSVAASLKQSAPYPKRVKAAPIRYNQICYQRGTAVCLL